jgi:very-long-chain enoyl-CoA reductase
MTGSWTMILFTVAGAVQMYFWAVKKHARYIKEFPDYPKKRKILVPFVL